MALDGEKGWLKLPTGRRYTVYGVLIGVWLTGAIWLIYHYFLQIPTEFGVQKHPMETFFLKVHGGFSFASLWVFGGLWWSHVLRGWDAHWRRWSGGFLTGITLFLIITGWGLYYFVARGLREWTSLTHWIVGLAAIAAFFLHWLSKSLPRRKRSE